MGLTLLETLRPSIDHPIFSSIRIGIPTCTSLELANLVLLAHSGTSNERKVPVAGGKIGIMLRKKILLVHYTSNVAPLAGT